MKNTIKKSDIQSIPSIVFVRHKILSHILVSNNGICFNEKSNRYLKPTLIKKSSKYLGVKVDGKYMNIKRMMYETFIGPIPNGYSCYLKNGIHTDLRIDNLDVCTKEELGAKTGGRNSRSKEVVLLDDKNNVINHFKSYRAAAKELYCSYQTVSDIINGKIRKPLFRLRLAKISD